MDFIVADHKVALAGVVGSTAHGTASPDSDEDILGVFVEPTHQILGLNRPRDSVVRTDPDQTFHEVEKFRRLALKVNPTITELLWLPEHLVATPVGERLVEMRRSFLSARAVRSAYLGYATSQWKKLQARGDSFSSKTAGRTLKHARHLFRLIESGQHLYETGELRVAVADPDWYRSALPDMTINQIADLSEQKMSAFENAVSGLLDYPDFDAVETFLLDVRRNHW